MSDPKCLCHTVGFDPKKNCVSCGSTCALCDKILSKQITSVQKEVGTLTTKVSKKGETVGKMRKDCLDLERECAKLEAELAESDNGNPNDPLIRRVGPQRRQKKM